MKLLHIASNNSGCLDEALVPVPDAYSKAEFDGAIADAEDLGVDDPYLLAIYKIEPAPKKDICLDEFRVFAG